MNDSAPSFFEADPAAASGAASSPPKDGEIFALLSGIRASLDELSKRFPGATVETALPEADSDCPVQRHEEYLEVVDRVCRLVDEHVPAGAIVAVVSKGDPALVNFHSCTGWHFPRNSLGQYAGHHPADSEAAITWLEETRALGAGYLVIPQTAFWWLDHYREFHEYLETRGTLIANEADTGMIVRLPQVTENRDGRRVGQAPPSAVQFRSLVESLLPDDARLLVIGTGDDAFLPCGRVEGRHFPAIEGGGHAGHHPANGAEAIALLEEEIRRGAHFLAVPTVSFWWLDFYDDFALAVASRHRLVTRQEHVAVIYELSSPDAAS